ncbi:hypothetical protein VB773_21810 [Haloarculaceae archaeon H-GB2-1]|nr:hypothetical protein [Haloarculaceae archaeon H-GB2-1]
MVSPPAGIRVGCAPAGRTDPHTPLDAPRGRVGARGSYGVAAVRAPPAPEGRGAKARAARVETVVARRATAGESWSSEEDAG